MSHRSSWCQRTGTLTAAAVAAALVSGLAAGGIGGAIGYHLADEGPPVRSTLELPAAGNQLVDIPGGSIAEVAQTVLPSVVKLQIQAGSRVGSGSGVVISSDGLILTNNHVIELAARDGQATALFLNGQRAPVEIVGRAPMADIAVVRVRNVSDLVVAELGRSSDLAVGQQVVAVGSPLGLQGTVTSGIISALDRPVRTGGQRSGQETVLNAIQTDAPINPGNSGGPLVDMQGRVIGINTAGASIGGPDAGGSIGLGFAIPIDQVKRIADDITASGTVNRAVLGVTVSSGRATEIRGAVVEGVVAGGAAAAAGIRPGEVITKIDDRLIAGGDELVAAIRSSPPGSQVDLTVGAPDGSNQRTVQATLGTQTSQAAR
ncbi:MAG: S1C family serine protease [Pseudonocardiaceae bacterium]